MTDSTFTFVAELWIYPGKAAWFFATLPMEQSDWVRFLSGRRRRGWGAVRVKARVGETEWETSIFPDAKSGCYLLPVKAAVRKQEGVVAGDNVSLTLQLLV